MHASNTKIQIDKQITNTKHKEDKQSEYYVIKTNGN